MARITLNSSLTFAEAFDNFIFHKTAQGVTDKTISCYKSHFKSISNYLTDFFLTLQMQFIQIGPAC